MSTEPDHTISNFRRKINAERRECVKSWATETVYAYIVESYRLYRAGALLREPRLTVTAIRDYFEQASTPDCFRYESKNGQRRIIQAAVDKLSRDKRIMFSWARGERRGHEVRAYEPAQ